MNLAPIESTFATFC